jgi:hypothetical protein
MIYLITSKLFFQAFSNIKIRTRRDENLVRRELCFEHIFNADLTKDVGKYMFYSLSSKSISTQFSTDTN